MSNSVREKSVVIPTLKYLNSQEDCWATKIHGGLYSGKGKPDIIGHCRGVFFAIEVKRPGKRPEKLQDYILGKIQSRGGLSTWVQNIDQVKELIFYIRSLKSLPVMPYNPRTRNGE
jgi:hypothetical protein